MPPEPGRRVASWPETQHALSKTMCSHAPDNCPVFPRTVVSEPIGGRSLVVVASIRERGRLDCVISQVHILDEDSMGVRRSRRSRKVGATREKSMHGNREEQACLGGLPVQSSVQVQPSYFWQGAGGRRESDGGEENVAGRNSCEYKARLASVYASEQDHVAHAQRTADPCALAS
ncbi:hypothetical protein L227DRAFT_209938 [Lentinus tigrinus ALCF2SS1-6]|uniref:Uncharacterized protein n=1 Tax=Lentinus tigrinus ALCF2SS1-6 TaxID=1328759 RepID=A0A5C2SQJ8_9APHY|nr:hypothetical protein L227DRAFT_209938 [Lentinus tigrinus ALCF2SS1-6]